MVAHVHTFLDSSTPPLAAADTPAKTDNVCHRQRLADERYLNERRPRCCLFLCVPIEAGSALDVLQVYERIHERCRSRRMWVEN